MSNSILLLLQHLHYVDVSVVFLFSFALSVKSFRIGRNKFSLCSGFSIPLHQLHIFKIQIFSVSDITTYIEKVVDILIF